MRKSHLSVSRHTLLVDGFPEVKFDSQDSVVINNEGGIATRQSGSMSISSLQGGTIDFYLSSDSSIIDITNKLMVRQMNSPCLFNICIMLDGEKVVDLEDCAFGVQPPITDQYVVAIEFLRNMEFHRMFDINIDLT